MAFTKIGLYAVGLLFLGLICACGPTSTRVLHHLPPRTDVDRVQIIHSAPKRDYYTVAEFEVLSYSESAIRSKGAQLGADAVYVASYSTFFVQPNDSTANARPSNFSQIEPGREMLCTAIKYR